MSHEDARACLVRARALRLRVKRRASDVWHRHPPSLHTPSLHKSHENGATPAEHMCTGSERHTRGHHAARPSSHHKQHATGALRTFWGVSFPMMILNSVDLPAYHYNMGYQLSHIPFLLLHAVRSRDSAGARVAMVGGTSPAWTGTCTETHAHAARPPAPLPPMMPTHDPGGTEKFRSSTNSCMARRHKVMLRRGWRSPWRQCVRGWVPMEARRPWLGAVFPPTGIRQACCTL